MKSNYDQDLAWYFTNVEHLRELFKNYVSAPVPPKRIIAIHGVGGVGKTSLLRMFRLHCNSVGIPVALVSGDEQKSALDVLIHWEEELKESGVMLRSFSSTLKHWRAIQVNVGMQLKDTDNARKRTADIAGKIVSKTGETAGGALAGAAIGSFIPGVGTVIGGGIGSILGGMGIEALVDWLRGFLTQLEIDLLLDPTKKLSNDFLRDVENIASKRRIVFIIDTVDQMTAFADWVQDVAQRLSNNTLLVVGGRALPNWSREWPSWLAYTQVEELKPMTKDVMRDLVRSYYATMRGGEPNPIQTEAIIDFARGLPIVVASAVRLWVEYGVEDFQAIKPRVVVDLVDRLMEGIPTQLTPAIEAAAVVRYFDHPILRSVMGLPDVRDAYSEMQRFPFVRPRAEGFTMHDSVREIMDENLHIQDSEQYYKYHERAAAYFENQLKKSGGEEFGVVTSRPTKSVIDQLSTSVKGKIDFAIITIREDEFEAVLDRFAPERQYLGDRRYVIGRIDLEGDDYYQVAIARSTDQGEGPAQDLARDMIEQLSPEWLLVVGIAGGVPDDDFSLGDVVVAKRLLDFSVKALNEDKPPEYDVRGWAHPLVEQICAALPAMRKKFDGEWNSPMSIGEVYPGVQLDQEGKYYGDDAWIQKVKTSLERHFKEPRSPRFTTAVIAATEELVKSPTLVQLWLQDARSLRAVEMELAGVYQAAKRTDHQYPVLAIRGISDIVGFKRDPGWTTYACHSAAAFAYTLVRSGFIKSSIASQTGTSTAKLPPDYSRSEQLPGLLELELLYHRICVDEEAGINLFQNIAEELVRYHLTNRLQSVLSDVNTYTLERESSKLWRQYYNARLAHLAGRVSDAEKVYQMIGEDEIAPPKLRAYALNDWGTILARYETLREAKGMEKTTQILLRSGEFVPIDLHLVESLLSLAKVARIEGQWDKQKQYLERARVFYENKKDNYGISRVLTDLKEANALRGDWKEVFITHEYAKNAIANLTKFSAPKGQLGRWVLVWAWAGRCNECEQQLKQSLAIARELQDDYSTMVYLRDIGWALGAQDKFSEAHQYLVESLSIARRLGDHFLHDQAVCLGYWGLVSSREGEFQQSQNHFEKSSQISPSKSSTPTLIILYSLLGGCAEAERNLKLAERYYSQCGQWETYGNNYFYAIALTGLARVKQRQGENYTIAPLFAEAERIAIQYEYNDCLASLKLTQGLMSIKTNSTESNRYKPTSMPSHPSGTKIFDDALEYFRQAMVYALRYNRFLLDELLSGRPQGTPLTPIIPYLIENGEEGRKILINLRNWWETSINDVGTQRPDTISPIPEGIALLEAESIARKREPGDGKSQKTVIEQIDGAL